MIRLLAFLLLALFPAQALGAGAEGHDQSKTAGGGVGAPGTNVDMPNLMAPITDADGKLTGYAYISGQLTAVSDSTVLAVRNKLAFIQDAFVRDVNGQPVTKPAAGPAVEPAAGPDDSGQVDIPALQVRLLADARRIMGAGKVKAYTVCTIQMAPLRPKPPTQGASPDAQPQKSRCIKQAAAD